MIKCEICGKEFKDLICLSHHISFHSIKSKEYYDIYLKKENEDICNLDGCNNRVEKFYGMSFGYNKFCCQEHDIEYRKLHPPKIKVKCEVCGRYFRDLTALMTHLYYVKNKNGHPENKKEYYEKYLGKEYKAECKICGKKFTRFN